MRWVIKVSTINDKTDPQNRPPLEGKQSTIVRNITTRVMDEDEFRFCMGFFEWILTEETVPFFD